MSFLKSKGFKYIKNLIIGVGAAVVLLGALFKLQSWEGAGLMLTIGLCTEAFIFFFLGVIGPEKDYYWEKLYPGLDKYGSNIAPLTAGDTDAGASKPLDGEVVENRLSGMLTELQTMSKSMSSLKALQEVDFSNVQEQMQGVNDFYSKMQEALGNMSDSIEDTKIYKDQLAALNKNLGNLNSVYGNMLNAMTVRGGDN